MAEGGCCGGCGEEQGRAVQHGSCQSHGGCGICCGRTEPITLHGRQKEFLFELAVNSCLPVVRFVRTSSISDELYTAVLAPVYLYSTGDTMETVQQTGVFLSDMERQGLILFRYGRPLDGYPYLEYTTSALYQAFAKETRCRPALEGDMPYLELGSMIPTIKGRQSLAIS